MAFVIMKVVIQANPYENPQDSSPQDCFVCGDLAVDRCWLSFRGEPDELYEWSLQFGSGFEVRGYESMEKDCPIWCKLGYCIDHAEHRHLVCLS